MPENQIPATQPEPGAEPGEFNFAKPASETPRIKRRSLKTKQPGLIKPSGSTPTVTRELEREAPPLSPEEAQAAKPRISEPAATSVKPAAPPRTTPSVASTMARQLASANAEAKAMATHTTSAPTATASPSIRSTATPTTSPHGTRPATLYYSSQPRKAETPAPASSPSPSPMKTIPTAPASSATTTTAPSSAARSATSAPRSTAPIDYRTNVERQSREQKSVGSILSYIVYGLIAIFLLGAILAGYGANVIFERINSQSVTVSELDAHYAAATKDLNSKLASTQDTLSQAQAQITRQQDLIVKQQDEINKLINAANDNSTAIKNERQARAQETSNLRIRLRQLEIKDAQQKL